MGSQVRGKPLHLTTHVIFMNFSIWLVSYNGGCSDDLCLLAGRFLLGEPRRSFGSAVTSFELYAWLKTHGRGWMKQRWDAAAKELPRVAFLRKYARFDISFLTSLQVADFPDLGAEDDFERKQTAAESLRSFRALCHEIASALQLAKQRLKKTDDFDWDAFAAQLSQQLDKVPKTTRELASLLKQLRKPVTEPRTDSPSPPRLSARALRRKPRIVAIAHDEHHANHIGRLSDGRQFFLTTPFVPAIGGAGCEFVALYLFDKRGRFLKAQIDNLGPRPKMDEQQARSLFERRLAQLGSVKHCRIRVQPFEVRRFGTIFGLVPRPLEDDEDGWCVAAQPGDYMAFFSPWNSGDYDT